MFGPCEGLGSRIREIESSTTDPQAKRIILPNFTCNHADQIRDLVKIVGNRTVQKINSNLKTHIPYGIAGMIYQKQSSTNCSLIIFGEFGGFAGLTPGLPIFVSHTGGITQTCPSSDILQQIGMAISNTEIILNIQMPIRRS